jgi:hypothetical protein
MELLLSHQTQFVRVYRLLHRQTDTTFLMKSLQNLIVSLRKTIMTETSPTIQIAHFTILKLLFKLIVYTRDIGGGLGERNISYCMLFIWKYHFPLPTAYCLNQMVSVVDDNNISYGSWRDIKGFCDFIRKHSEKGENDPFIETCIGLMNHQLDKDSRNNSKSLVSRWIPRESSAHKWLFDRCALQWIRAFRPQYLKSARNTYSLGKAMNKGKKEYRILCSSLSKHAETIQIKQCANQWHTIVPEHIPMIAMSTQHNALRNIGLNGIIRTKTLHSKDRQACALKIQSWWEHHKSTKRPIYIEMGTIIKQALSKYHQRTAESLWGSVLKQIPSTSYMIPVLDMSLFHTNTESFYHALGMALAIACKSTVFGDQKRLLVFDKTARFVTLSGNLSQMLDMLKPMYHEHHIGSVIEHAFSEIQIYEKTDTLLVIFSHSRHVQCKQNVLYWTGMPTGKCENENEKIFVGCTNHTISRIAEIQSESASWKHITPFLFIQFLLSHNRYDQIDTYFDTILTGGRSPPKTPICG